MHIFTIITVINIYLLFPIPKLLLPKITNSKKMPLLQKQNISLISSLLYIYPSTTIFSLSIYLFISIWWHTHVVGQHVEGLQSWVQLFLTRPRLSVGPATLQLPRGPGIMVVFTELLDQVLDVFIHLNTERWRHRHMYTCS